MRHTHRFAPLCHTPPCTKMSNEELRIVHTSLPHPYELSTHNLARSWWQQSSAQGKHPQRTQTFIFVQTRLSPHPSPSPAECHEPPPPRRNAPLGFPTATLRCRPPKRKMPILLATLRCQFDCCVHARRRMACPPAVVLGSQGIGPSSAACGTSSVWWAAASLSADQPDVTGTATYWKQLFNLLPWGRPHQRAKDVPTCLGHIIFQGKCNFLHCQGKPGRRGAGPPPRPDDPPTSHLTFQSPRNCTAGGNGSGRGPDAGRTRGFKETAAGRTRVVPFLPGLPSGTHGTALFPAYLDPACATKAKKRCGGGQKEWKTAIFFCSPGYSSSQKKGWKARAR
eukprot:gene22670-biopygen1193